MSKAKRAQALAKRYDEIFTNVNHEKAKEDRKNREDPKDVDEVEERKNDRTCFQVNFVPLDVPNTLKPFCTDGELFVRSLDEIPAALKDVSIQALLEAFRSVGGDTSTNSGENIAVLLFFLRQQGFRVNRAAATLTECCSAIDLFIVTSTEIVSSCAACRKHQENLLAHMEVGGCTYESE